MKSKGAHQWENPNLRAEAPHKKSGMPMVRMTGCAVRPGVPGIQNLLSLCTSDFAGDDDHARAGRDGDGQTGFHEFLTGQFGLARDVRVVDDVNGRRLPPARSVDTSPACLIPNSPLGPPAQYPRVHCTLTDTEFRRAISRGLPIENTDNLGECSRPRMKARVTSGRRHSREWIPAGPDHRRFAPASPGGRHRDHRQRIPPK